MLESNVDSLENKSRKSNLLIYGMLEGTEKDNTVAFVQRLLPAMLVRDIKGISPLHIDREHRISTPKAPRLRPIIVKFGDYQQNLKERSCAQYQGEDLVYNVRRISIYSDFSATVRKNHVCVLTVNTHQLSYLWDWLSVCQELS